MPARFEDMMLILRLSASHTRSLSLVSTNTYVSFIAIMRTTTILLLLLHCTVANLVPKISIDLRNGSFDGLQGFDPIVAISDELENDVDGESLSYGLSCNFANGDLSTFPKSGWGKYSKVSSKNGWGVSAKVDFQVASVLESVDLEVNAENEGEDIGATLIARAGDLAAIKSFDVTKGFKAYDGKVTINQSWDFEDGSSQLRVERKGENSSLEWISSKSKESALKLTRYIGKSNKISPCVTSNGVLSLDIEVGDESGDHSLNTSINGNTVGVAWSDGDWQALFSIPLDGNTITGTNIGVKREIVF